MTTTWCGLIFFLGRESDDQLPLYCPNVDFPETTEKSFSRSLIKGVVREVTLHYYLIYSWVTLKYTLEVYKSVHRLYPKVVKNVLIWVWQERLMKVGSGSWDQNTISGHSPLFCKLMTESDSVDGARPNSGRAFCLKPVRVIGKAVLWTCLFTLFPNRILEQL